VPVKNPDSPAMRRARAGGDDSAQDRQRPAALIRSPTSVFLALCDFCQGRPLYNSLDSGEAMAERDLTAREDRFIALCLVAAAIMVVFIIIASS
jgi:hypothetical protein